MQEIKPEETRNFNLEVKYIELRHQMEDGEITEDDFRTECEKLNIILDNKGSMQLVDIDNRGQNKIKKENEDYKTYFGNNQREFKNILGI